MPGKFFTWEVMDGYGGQAVVVRKVLLTLEHPPPWEYEVFNLFNTREYMGHYILQGQAQQTSIKNSVSGLD